MVIAGFENITQPPGTIFPDLNAHIDMVRSQIGTFRRRWDIMDMTMQVDPTIFKGDDRAMRKNQFHLIGYLDVQGVFYQGYATGLKIRFADPVMVTLD